MEKKDGCFYRIFKILNNFRIISLNVMFFAFLFCLIAFLLYALRDKTPTLPDSFILSLKIKGNIVEQKKTPDIQELRLKLFSEKEDSNTLLSDITDSIKNAGKDKRVKALFLDLDNMRGAGLTKLYDICEAIKEFKKTGKKVVAFANFYNQSSYYLASIADTIYTSPQSILMFNGFGVYKMYFKEGLDKFLIDMNVFRVGKYKSAVEPFLRESMSDEAKEANMKWLGSLWQDYLDAIASQRKVKKNILIDYIENFDSKLEEYKGDGTKLALDNKLIDKPLFKTDLKEVLAKFTGNSFSSVDFRKYLSVNPFKRKFKTFDAVAVIMAKGTIYDGKKEPGAIGGVSTANLLRRAAKNKSVKAVVLRVDSPGGSAFASEMIRKEIDNLHKIGKPVIASMSSMAASGGYWISMSCDEIWAYPTTITGSIGIFGVIPTFQRALKKYMGVNVDGCGTTPYSGAFSQVKGLDEKAKKIFQTFINKGYNDFISKVAKYRNMSVEEADKIAQGRVWSGRDAKENGLIDKFGNLEDAIKSAAKKAKLKEGYRVFQIKQPLSMRAQLIAEILKNSSSNTSLKSKNLMSNINKLLNFKDPIWILNDPQGIYALMNLGISL